MLSRPRPELLPISRANLPISSKRLTNVYGLPVRVPMMVIAVDAMKEEFRPRLRIQKVPGGVRLTPELKPAVSIVLKTVMEFSYHD